MVYTLMAAIYLKAKSTLPSGPPLGSSIILTEKIKQHVAQWKPNGPYYSRWGPSLNGSGFRFSVLETTDGSVDLDKRALG